MLLKRSFVAISKRSSHSFRNFLQDLESRDLVKSSYPSDLVSKFSKELSTLPRCAYAGFDPTASSLHVGNLLVVVNLLRASKHGIRPIVVIGGATARIGDPSGRESERNVIDENVVERNAQGITRQMSALFCRASTSYEPVIVSNIDWFGEMNMVSYLRHCKRMQVGDMLRMGAVKSRMDSGISFTEFSYQTMQAYDWLNLANRFNCHFQIGGSDQLGHLDFGAHYIKKMTGNFAAGVCLPLLTDSAGNKLGKSVGGGSLWLDATLTSPYNFYQYFAQLHDTVADRLLVQLSLKPLDELRCILKNHQENLGKWIAQRALAEEITQFVHGDAGLDMARRCTKALFGGKTPDLSELNREEILQLFGNHVELSRNEVKTFGDLADKTRTDKIKGSILMEKGAFSVNNIKKTKSGESLDMISATLPNARDLSLICWGKRKYQLVRWI